jgi:hypothetical protein
VRSLESSIHSQSSASQARSEDDAITDAKLVTLHLDKVDGGIWPVLVSGPASISLVQPEYPSPFLSQPRLQNISAALSEALRQPTLDDHQSVVLEDESNAQLDDSFTQSTITVDTMNSDDSTTVLGMQSTSEEEERLYDMDPTSLALMGVTHSKQGARSPFSSTSTQESASAFEYFKRAWRRAEIPLATKRLVEDYLPLSPQRSNTSNMLRSRLTASLGGSSALARLYVSYARLHLPCFQDRQSPLAFPLGGLTNPFGRGVHGQDRLSSPRPQGDQSIEHDPLMYLREARNIDRNVVISEEEWSEAQAIAAHSPSGDGPLLWDQPETINKASDGEKTSQGRQSASEGHKREKRRKKKMGSKLHRDDISKSSEKFTSDQGLVFVLVSRVALISVMVAGGVAVAGWWRRAASAGVGS